MITTTITYGVAFLMGLLQYMSAGIVNPGKGMPPPYDPQYDLNGDGFINIQDLLICLANFG